MHWRFGLCVFLFAESCAALVQYHTGRVKQDDPQSKLQQRLQDAFAVLPAQFQADFRKAYDSGILPTNWTRQQTGGPAVLHQSRSARKQNSVLVYKVESFHKEVAVKGLLPDLLRSLCLMTKHFNQKYLYPIVIFSNEPATADEEAQIRSAAGGATVTFATVEVALKSFLGLSYLSEDDRATFLSNCQVSRASELTTDTVCMTRIGACPLGYIFMCAWNYLYMFQHPALKGFDHFVYVDSDAYTLKSWDFDPFELFDSYGVDFLYNQRSNSAWEGDESPQLATSIFGPLANLTLGPSEEIFEVFDTMGSYRGASYGGWFSGGYLERFRSSIYQSFAAKVLQSGITHLYRVDQQQIITIGITALSYESSGMIWYLPSHHQHTNMFHNWFFDNQLMCEPEVYTEDSLRLVSGDVGDGECPDGFTGSCNFPKLVRLAVQDKVPGLKLNDKDRHVLMTCADDLGDLELTQAFS